MEGVKDEYTIDKEHWAIACHEAAASKLREYESDIMDLAAAVKGGAELKWVSEGRNDLADVMDTVNMLDIFASEFNPEALDEIEEAFRSAGVRPDPDKLADIAGLTAGMYQRYVFEEGLNDLGEGVRGTLEDMKTAGDLAEFGIPGGEDGRDGMDAIAEEKRDEAGLGTKAPQTAAHEVER